MCFYCVRLCFVILSQEIGLGNVSEMTILCRVGRKTATQSIPKFHDKINPLLSYCANNQTNPGQNIVVAY